jgi:hypothetical protein
MAMYDCSFQEVSLLHPNDIYEAMHVSQIHDNVALEVVESAILFFSMQLLVSYETICVITPIVLSKEGLLYILTMYLKQSMCIISMIMLHWKWWKVLSCFSSPVTVSKL